MSVWSDWVNEGALRKRFRMQGGDLVSELHQPGEDRILELNKQRRNGDKPKDLSFGRYLGEVPERTILEWQTKHPDLFSPDAEIQRKATIKFWNSTEAAPFRVQRA
jgi:hypothetical protein